jgi:hypothetical protein
MISTALVGVLCTALTGVVAAHAQSTKGDEAGTLKGVRGTPQPATPGAPKAKSGKGSGLMEEEGIFYKDKPAPTGKPNSR